MFLFCFVFTFWLLLVLPTYLTIFPPFSTISEWLESFRLETYLPLTSLSFVEKYFLSWAPRMVKAHLCFWKNSFLVLEISFQFSSYLGLLQNGEGFLNLNQNSCWKKANWFFRRNNLLKTRNVIREWDSTPVSCGGTWDHNQFRMLSKHMKKCTHSIQIKPARAGLRHVCKF